MRRLAAVLAPLALFLASCSSGGTEVAAPNDAGQASEVVAPAADAGAAADAEAADASDEDASCAPTLDDAGVTHGCKPGSMGPGDRDDGGDQIDHLGREPDAMNLPFGAACLSGEQCTTGVCFDFQARGTFCTQPCTTNADCPSTLLGCNGMGFCKVSP